DLTANIEKANLQQLKLLDQNLEIKTKATLNFTGLKIDELHGTASFRETVVSYDGKPVSIDTLDLTSTFDEGGRQLKLRSELFNLNAHGNFQYSTLIHDIGTLVTEYKLNFKNNATATANYYRHK